MEAAEYQEESKRTENINWLNPHGPDVAILGVIGELGSLASVLKKHQRDGIYYSAFEEHFEEELGDILWYAVTIASRLGIKLNEWPIDSEGIVDEFEGVYKIHSSVMKLSLQKDWMFKPDSVNKELAVSLVNNLIMDLSSLANHIATDLKTVARNSCNKNLSYWAKFSDLPARTFDKDFPSHEKLPRKFEIDFYGIEDNKAVIIMMNGVALGDRLTDNAYVDDGYRFHDVFHIALAATLGWSPVFRRMLKKKRKSVPKTDEIQDGARAAIIEEAIINHVYDYARTSKNYLEGMSRVDLDLIKRIQNLVRGYEVEKCEPWEWKDSIMKSYKIFRELKSKGSGRVVVDCEKRSLTLTDIPVQ
ncbi:MAG: nucleoside triphosphate pyrophosphohydrolase family protein [Kangiellaceae bacterium]|nr:nucleoside triphosphate pyrophosphohydrolase family protein [Kangiellaceae bacterium]MCW9016305.1 nucleoside triphosphate pyrophosphohydrolase family protein [Kangiellaceae bacterium]